MAEVNTNPFDGDFETGVAAETPTKTAKSEADLEKKRRAKEQRDKMMAALDATKQADPTYMQRRGAWSHSIRVVNSLGWGDKGNIVVDHSATKVGADGKTERALASTSVIVGYRVENTGDQPIPYQCNEWHMDENGKYVSQRVQKTLAANGGQADLSRVDMTALCSVPEIAFTLANGKVMRGSASAGRDPKRPASLEDELGAYYFSFDAEAKLNVNSDDVKLNVGVKGADGKWTLKPEFESTFGYLMNVKERAARQPKSKAEQTTSSELFANYVQRLINGGL